MKNLPILICIKEKSKRCPDKNFRLLPYTLNYLTQLGKIYITTIITDSFVFGNIAAMYNVHNYYVETIEENQDELMSAYKYAIENNIDEFILLPVTQPIREFDLIDRIEDEQYDSYDLVTSFNILPDRKPFELENQTTFKILSKERKGSIVRDMPFADGAIYRIKTKFLEKCINSGMTNYNFWNTDNKIFIYNDVPFVDIDTQHDLAHFEKFYRKFIY